MEDVTVKKELLLERVKENREAHSVLTRKAREGFRARAIIELHNQLQRAREGKSFKVNLCLVEPEDHTREYDRLIEMLEFSANDLITLRVRDFRRYVLDEWEWQEEFQSSVTGYIN